MAARRPVPDYEPDIAARAAVLMAILWAVLATGVGVLVQASLVRPAMFSGPLAYGRLRPVHDALFVFGWLSMAGFAAVFTIVPRLARVRLYNEILGATTAWFWSVTLFAGAALLLLGFNQGRPLAELPLVLDVGLVVLAVMVAYNALMTLTRRRERTLYVSAWYLLAAIVGLPLVYVVGNVGVLTGVRDSIVSGFYQGGIEMLWLLPLGLAVAHYVVPQVTGGALHSRQLALISFWSLVLVGGWTGARYGVLGPAPDWLESIGVAMTVVLFVPVLSAVANLFASGGRLWGLVAEDIGLRWTATALVSLLAWLALTSLSSMRSVARVVGLTAWDAGVRHLATYVVFSAFAFALVSHMFPRLVGRRWWSDRAMRIHFWTTVVGGVAGTLAALGAGLVQSGMRLAYAANLDESSLSDVSAQIAQSMRGWNTVRFLAALLVAAAQLVLAWNAFQTSRRGEPLVLVAEPPVAVGTRS